MLKRKTLYLKQLMNINIILLNKLMIINIILLSKHLIDYYMQDFKGVQLCLNAIIALCAIILTIKFIFKN